MFNTRFSGMSHSVGGLLRKRDGGSEEPPVLFLGGCTYAAAYILLSLAGISAWSGLLAVAGTCLILIGLRRTWGRA